jgi:ATP-dependent exoDNAse (exonuclease V) beta subunit
MYVAATRARNHLVVTYPLNVYSTRRGADYSMDQLSRFLDRGVRGKMQRVVLTENGAPTPEAAPVPEQPPLDLRALLRSRFTK